MTAVYDSILVRFLLRMSAFGRESAVYAFLARRGAGLRRAGAESAAVDFLVREGAVNRAWPNSLTAYLLAALFNVPCALVKWVYRAGRGVFDGSLTFRVLTRVGQAACVLVGLLMTVMLVVPHASWNNRYALLGICAVTAFFILGSANSRARMEPTVLGPYFSLYMAAIVMALITSLSTRLSMRAFGFHVTAFLIALLLISAVRSYRDLHRMSILTAAGLTVASLFGCYQGMVGVKVVASQQDMILNKDMPGRVFSFFDNPNNFAEILVMLIPLLLALFLNAKSGRGKVLAAFAVLPCVAAIGLTYSRSGWLGLGLALLIFLALQDWRFLPALFVLGVLAIPFLPQTIINRFLTIGNMEDTSAKYRIAIYGAAENLLKDYWLRGVGLDNEVMKAVFRAAYPTLYDGNWPIHTHNNYLQIWGEAGILGLLAYLALLLGQIKAGLKAWHKSTSREVRNLLSAALAGLSGILLIGFAEYTWFYPRNMFLFWFLVGLIAACVKLTQTSPPRRADRD